ncbi:MAG TPA: TIGR04053 family radical SAM/SPASM domain-containing protein [Nitrososphaerales archaeon]|nr:TIGR04053 family radical SAM/SPASM domain-containing protein [Nitrososphaerales archaeon]
MRPPWTVRTDVSQAPLFVCWETTKACLLACRHCRAKAIRRPVQGELDHSQGLALIDQLLDFGEPYPALLLTGGDPLMRDDFFDLVEHAKKSGLYVAVAASVTPKLNEMSIARMKELDVDIMSVSLDGATPSTHDRLRGVPGTWAATVQALRNARRAGLRAQVNTTVMRSNIDELADIFHIVKEAGSVAWEVFFLIRTGRGASLESLQPSECEEVMHFLYDASQYGMPVRTAEGPNFRRVRVEREKEMAPPMGQIYQKLAGRLKVLEGEPIDQPSVKVSHTGDGKGIMFVGHNGEVYPSGFLPVLTGRAPSENLVSIYRSNTLFADLRDPSKLKGRCGACEYNTICGGSRSRAFAELGDAFGEDPACPYIPVAARPVPARA